MTLFRGLEKVNRDITRDSQFQFAFSTYQGDAYRCSDSKTCLENSSSLICVFACSISYYRFPF